jgi:hypothetical protein
MGARSTKEVRRELAAERKRLGDAVHTLRSESGQVAKKLSVAALGATAVGIAARVFRHRQPEKEERGRLPFLRRN